QPRRRSRSSDRRNLMPAKAFPHNVEPARERRVSEGALAVRGPHLHFHRPHRPGRLSRDPRHRAPTRRSARARHRHRPGLRGEVAWDCSKNPWTVHGGWADKIAIESEIMRDHYRREGLADSKLEMVGALAADELYQRSCGILWLLRPISG